MDIFKSKKDDDKKNDITAKQQQQEKIMAKMDYVQEHKPKFENLSSHDIFFDDKMMDALMGNNLGLAAAG